MVLASRKVLLFDNTKFEFANYESALAEIGRTLEASGYSTVAMTRSIRGDAAVGLKDLVEEILSLDVDGAVLGFADAGVTPATTKLAILFRARGLPTVVVTGDPGHALASEMTAYQDPNLPLVHLPLRQWMTEGRVTQVTRAQVAPLEVLLGVAPTNADVSQPQRIPRGLDGEDTYIWLLDQGVSDGLPVVPLDDDRVGDMLSSVSTESDRVLVADLAPSGCDLYVAGAAEAAVLSGCEPRHFPFVVAALDGIGKPEFAQWQAATSTHPAAIMVLASGPLTDQAGLHSGAGSLGPGFRANATIGRAVNLALLLTGRATPGKANLATQGSPAQYTYCFAENRQASPWPGLHVDRFDEATTSVTVFFGEGPHNVVEMLSDDAESIVRSVAATSATLGSNNAYISGELIVVLCPDHARIISDSGWSKSDVQEYLFEDVRLPAGQVDGRGQAAIRPSWATGLDRLPAILDPEAVTVVVAGGSGGHSSVAVPWGMNRSVTNPVLAKAVTS